jgi:hypothetical protein
MPMQLRIYSFSTEQWIIREIERPVFRFYHGHFMKKNKVPFSYLIKAKANINHVKEEQCQVCLETNCNIYTACNHQFCEPCMKKWHKQCENCETKQFSCPMCRSPIDVLYKEFPPVDVNSLD